MVGKVRPQPRGREGLITGKPVGEDIGPPRRFHFFRALLNDKNAL